MGSGTESHGPDTGSPVAAFQFLPSPAPACFPLCQLHLLLAWLLAEWGFSPPEACVVSVSYSPGRWGRPKLVPHPLQVPELGGWVLVLGGEGPWPPPTTLTPPFGRS